MSLPPSEFLKYQERLVACVSQRSDVLGLMFAGSSANLARADKYSDHDFYLIVEDQVAEKYRQELDWLPDSEDILLRPRETQHGLKVMYKDGRLLEFAVFADSELDSQIAPPDRAVAFDRGGIADRIEAIGLKETSKFNVEDELALFLTLVHIGLGRARRGEIVAANQHIKGYAVNHLVGIIRNSTGDKANADALNRYRRFELDRPEEATAIGKALDLPAEQAAAELIENASDWVPTRLLPQFNAARALILKVSD
jgi:hypothetical protein